MEQYKHSEHTHTQSRPYSVYKHTDIIIFLLCSGLERWLWVIGHAFSRLPMLRLMVQFRMLANSNLLVNHACCILLTYLLTMEHLITRVLYYTFTIRNYKLHLSVLLHLATTLNPFILIILCPEYSPHFYLEYSSPQIRYSQSSTHLNVWGENHSCNRMLEWNPRMSTRIFGFNQHSCPSLCHFFS